MGSVMLSLFRPMASAPPPNTETTSTQPMLKASVTGQGGPNHARTEVGVHEVANRHRDFHVAPASSLSVRAALEIENGQSLLHVRPLRTHVEKVDSLPCPQEFLKRTWVESARCRRFHSQQMALGHMGYLAILTLFAVRCVLAGLVRLRVRATIRRQVAPSGLCITMAVPLYMPAT